MNEALSGMTVGDTCLLRHLPVLVELFPFFGALTVTLIGLRWRSLCQPIALTALAFSFACSMTLCFIVAQGNGQPVEYRLGGWPPPIGIIYVIDGMNAAVLALVSGVGFLAAWSARATLGLDAPGKEPAFYALLLLTVAGLAGMSVTGDAFNLYVLMEVTSICTYALVGMGRGRAALAGFNYLILGTIGASFYLLGVGYIYIKTGTLNIADLASVLPGLRESPAIKAGFLLILVGSFLKMGFFPLHGWLPSAYTFAPSAAATLMAPLVTKVWIYVMARMLFSIFLPEYVFENLNWSEWIPYFAAAAIVFGAYRAVRAQELRRAFAYLIIAEVGYMVGGVWLGNRNGLTGALFHVLVDGLMTLCLFLFAAALAARKLPLTREGLPGLYRRMPLTMIGFTVAALSMIGLPPTGGFFSKWYLLTGALEAKSYAYFVALILASLANAFLFFRLIEKAHFEPLQDHQDHAEHGHAPDTSSHDQSRHEPEPWSITLPMLIAATGVLALGIFSSQIVGGLLRDAIPEVWP